MNPVIKTGPAKYPVELKEVKEQLNLTVGWTDDDEWLKRAIAVATSKVEQYLKRRLITQTWYAYYDAWPTGDAIVLPFGKLQSVTTVKYTETSGTQTTWSATEYNADTDSDPGRVVLEYGYPWPSFDLNPLNPVEVEFVCGYGTTGSSVEPSIKHAMVMAIDDLYNNRGDKLVGVLSQDMRISTGLLWPFRIFERATT
ncbi:MAG: hypothetical protein GY841_12475 [FCB group bacterium]|nr:hypothetical protein [FCB group bacterium]